MGRIFGPAKESAAEKFAGSAEQEQEQAQPAVEEAAVEAQPAPEAPAARKEKGRGKGKAREEAAAPAAQRRPLIRQMPNLTAGLDGVSRSLVSEALFGDNEEIERLFREGIEGMPQEHLFLQAVMSMDAIPVKQNISVIGEASSCKTWLAWEMGKPFACLGGMVYLIRAEKKWDPESARAIFTLLRNPDYDPFLKPGVDPDYEDLSGPNPFFTVVPELFSLKTAKENGYINVLCAESQEDIQSALLADCKAIEAMYGKEIGKGKDKAAIPRFPVYFLFDSLQYVTSEGIMNGVEKGKEEGYGDMHKASAFKEFLQTWANRQQVRNPFTLNTINHRKPGTEGRVEAGGFHKEAVYITKLFLEKDRYQMDQKTGVDGTQPIIKIRPHKNSMGAEHGYGMEVKMHIWTDKGDQTGYPLRAAFLWEEAFANMLTPLGLEKCKRSKTVAKQLGYEFKGNKFVCERLGFTEKNPASPVNFAVAAQRDPAFVKEFQDVFGVRRLKKYEF